MDEVFADLTSSFLVMPKGNLFVDYPEFSAAYECLKRNTAAFSSLTLDSLWAAVLENSLCVLVVRTILGMTPPEWAELTRSEGYEDVDAGWLRGFDSKIRVDPTFAARQKREATVVKIRAILEVACQHLNAIVPEGSVDTVHRLNKFDTSEGTATIRNAADHGVPYAVLLYERYLGRPFASHRDSVSELVGDVMESAIEERLASSHITFRKTKRAERIPNFEQAPDFIVPDEIVPAVVIEAKMAGDEGTARDKVARIIRLTQISDERVQAGKPGFEVVACIDGRGFVRRGDVRQLLTRTKGKVFTLANLDDLVPHTDLAKFVAP
ncbi:MAG: hypothetical protein ACYDC4_15000 [Candidatus Dormibacteria bacterium]